MFWDVLVLFRDLFHASSANVAIMERLLALPPTKFLELGTNQLLMGYFGGMEVRVHLGVHPGVHPVETQERNVSVGKQVDMDGPAPSPKRSHPLKQSEWDRINLGHRVEVPTEKCITEGRETLRDEEDKGRWFPVGTSSAMT